MSSLPRSTPEAQGLSTAALDAFVGALDASDQELQTLMLMRHGQVVLAEEWAPYRLHERHALFSVSKSFTSTGIGLLIEEGKLSLEDKVVSFFDGDDLPDQISDNLAAMEIRHLLTMSTGQTQEVADSPSRDPRMVRTFLGLEVAHAPGAPFAYNNRATYLLSAILQKLTGETLLDYLRPRLFEPLGIDEATWQLSREGIVAGGWGLNLSTESLAKFSQLLIQRGEWEGKQLVPAAWIDEATRKQVDNSNQDNPDWQQGYGFQFWRARHNAYRGDGAFGQYCLVFPDHDATLVITSASPDMQAVMDLIWEHLLPAFEGGTGDGTPRPATLELPAPTGEAPRGDGRTHQFDHNDTGFTAIKLGEDGTVTLTLETPESKTLDIVCTPGEWSEAFDTLQDPPQRLVTSVYGEGETTVVTVRYLETPFVATLRCRLEDERLIVDLHFNVNFGPLESTLTSK